MLEDFAVVTGAIVSAITIGISVRAAQGALRRRQAETELRIAIGRLTRLDRRLCGLVVAVDDRLATGVEWAGLGEWPKGLGGFLTYLYGTIDELERTEANLRAMDTDGPTERLRGDVERMAVVLRQACSMYVDGTFESYHEHEGAALPPSAAGREVTPSLGDDRADPLRRLRDEFTTLMRTCFYRLEADNAAERYRAIWPIERWELEGARKLEVWTTEPHPMDW